MVVIYIERLCLGHSFIEVFIRVLMDKDIEHIINILKTEKNIEIFLTLMLGAFTSGVIAAGGSSKLLLEAQQQYKKTMDIIKNVYRENRKMS